MTRRLSKAARHLQEVDPVMAHLIDELGACTMGRRREKDPFASLVQSIVAQMISGKAARTVYGRLLEVLDEEVPSPGRAARTSEKKLRGAGLSGTKARAIRELAKRALSGEISFSCLPEWENERVKRALIAVPGIGEWTAQMFLMFHLRRPDIFPAKDLGILEGMKRAYGLRTRPTPKAAARRAEPWAPYRSTGSWYLWRVLGGPVGLK